MRFPRPVAIVLATAASGAILLSASPASATPRSDIAGTVRACLTRYAPDDSDATFRRCGYDKAISAVGREEMRKSGCGTKAWPEPFIACRERLGKRYEREAKGQLTLAGRAEGRAKATVARADREQEKAYKAWGRTPDGSAADRAAHAAYDRAYARYVKAHKAWVRSYNKTIILKGALSGTRYRP